MKSLILSVLALTAFTVIIASSAARADMSDTMDAQGNYTVPVTDQTLEPYSHFHLNKYKVIMLNDGRHQMTWSLPFDLTGGRDVPVVMIDGAHLDWCDANADAQLSGPKGDACCFGVDWDQLSCDFKFHNVGVTAQQAQNYLDQKYAGQARTTQMKNVAVAFNNDPIGKGETFGKDGDCDGCSVGNGEYNVQYQSPSGQWITNVKMSLDRNAGEYWIPGTGSSGSLFDVNYNGQELNANWTMGSVSGWCKFEFNGNSFHGTWGSIGSEQASGQWNGTRYHP